MFASIRFKLDQCIGSILIELMLVMVIGLLLISFLLETYTTSKQSYALQSALSQLQDNAKTAIDILKSDIHKAGYIGCPYLSHDFVVHSPYPSYSLTSQNKLAGTIAELIVRYMEFAGASLIKSMQDTETLYVNKTKRFAKGDILVISDCKQAEIFQVKEVVLLKDSLILIPMLPLQNRYERYAEIGRLIMNKYFIAKSKRHHQDGSPIYSLFVQDIKQNKTELVEDVDHMQIHYTERENNVVGVAIELTLSSQSFKKSWHLYVSLIKE